MSDAMKGPSPMQQLAAAVDSLVHLAVASQTVLLWMVGAPHPDGRPVTDAEARGQARKMAAIAGEVLGPFNRGDDREGPFQLVTPEEIERAWAEAELKTLPLRAESELPPGSVLGQALAKLAATEAPRGPGFVLVLPSANDAYRAACSPSTS